MRNRAAPRNPFKPTFGVTPPLLVGRDDLIEAFGDALDADPGAESRATLYTGARGSGKTVMLNAVEDEAKDHGWVVISETASPGFIDRLTKQQLPSLLNQFDPNAVKKYLAGITGPLNIGGMNWETVQTHIVEAGLRNQIELLTDLLRDLSQSLSEPDEDSAGLLITLDEIHRNQIEELRQLAIVIQHAFREERQVAFVGAGLTSSISDVLQDEVLTFLRRAEKHHLGPVMLDDVERAIQTPIETNGRAVSEEALAVMAEGTLGYPFLIQLVGAQAWRLRPDIPEISLEDAHEGVARAQRRLGALVHEPALAEASNIDKSFLLAMAKDDGPSKMADIAERLGVTRTYASQYRLRLIDAELIESPQWGYVDFALPYLREYLRDHATSDV